MKEMIPAVALMLALAAGFPAASQAPQRHVSYADLNLTTDAGRTALQRRVKHAAYSVCADEDDRDLGAMRRMRQCRLNALAGAAPQVARAINQATQVAAARTAIRLSSR